MKKTTKDVLCARGAAIALTVVAGIGFGVGKYTGSDESLPNTHEGREACASSLYTKEIGRYSLNAAQLMSLTANPEDQSVIKETLPNLVGQLGSNSMKLVDVTAFTNPDTKAGNNNDENLGLIGTTETLVSELEKFDNPLQGPATFDVRRSYHGGDAGQVVGIRVSQVVC
jgi:hypothetical protein